ncbi:Diphthamide biosynthesis protein 1 [Didymella keratinophila]|nr:Diphthamide biosynthesis protein 1 [Didymella keratinophila]
MSQATSAKANTTAVAGPSGPLLVFVLGAPCSGKSTLCAALAKRYDVEHFSLGDELRPLVSDEPSSHAARIKNLLSVSELEIFRSNLHAGTLGPVHLTPKYVKERVFPTGCNPKDVRVLIDGFPRDSQRWVPFKEFAAPYWMPSKGSLLIVLDVDEEVVRERFLKRGRPGDVFDRRFREHTGMITEIVKAMEKDGLTICRVGKEGEDLQAVIKSLAELSR